jgi:serine protease inhibitor
MYTSQVNTITTLFTPSFGDKGFIFSPFGIYSSLALGHKELNNDQEQELSQYFDLDVLKKLPNPFVLEKSLKHESITFKVVAGKKNAFIKKRMIFTCDISDPKAACEFVTKHINEMHCEKSKKTDSDDSDDENDENNKTDMQNIPIINESVFTSNFKSCIINDLYFAGDWKAYSSKLDFKIKKDKNVEVKALEFLFGNCMAHLGTDGTIFFEICCKNEYSMYIKFNQNNVFPVVKEDFEKPMTKYDIDKIKIPYFSTSSNDLDFTAILKKYFPKCCNENNLYYIRNILQSCYLDVNEKGLKARSITKTFMAKKCIQNKKDYPELEILVDSPFSFVIRDKVNKLDLMCGVIGVDGFGLVPQ